MIKLLLWTRIFLAWTLALGGLGIGSSSRNSSNNRSLAVPVAVIVVEGFQVTRQWQPRAQRSCGYLSHVQKVIDGPNKRPIVYGSSSLWPSFLTVPKTNDPNDYQKERRVVNNRGPSRVTMSSSSSSFNYSLSFIAPIMDRKLLQTAWNVICLRPFQFMSAQLHTMTFGQRWLLAMAFVLGIGMGRLLSRPSFFFWQRYRSVDDIPRGLFGATAPPLKGRAAAVTDGDTIRFLHQPTPFHGKTLDKNKGQKLSTDALPIRVCTIDTPETAKFGKPGQPYGQDAKDALTQFLQNRTVYCRLLQKDQYGRAVAQIFIKEPLLSSLLRRQQRPKYVDEFMLQQGLAEVYRGGGAVYGPKGLEWYNAMEAQAQEKKLGIWSQGNNRESAAEFKKRTKT